MSDFAIRRQRLLNLSRDLETLTLDGNAVCSYYASAFDVLAIVFLPYIC